MPAFNTNRNVNLAVPVIRIGGQGRVPDTLPYLTNLKLFVWYTDLPIQVDLTGSLNYWQPYYSQSVISSSQTVFGTIQNTYPSGTAPVSRSGEDTPNYVDATPPYFSGSYLRQYSSSFQDYTQFSSLLNDISTSYTIAFTAKIDPTKLANLYGSQGTNEFTLWEKSVQNPKGGMPNYTKGVTYVSGSDNFKLYTGEVFTTGAIETYVMDTTASVSYINDDYHMIALSVTGNVATMYIDNQPLSGAFTLESFNTTSSIFTMGRNITAPPNDILPNLSTLKKFEYYTDEPANTVLSGWDPVNTNVFLSSSWDSYYSASALNMNVSSSWFNTIKYGGDATAGNYPISRSAALEGPFMWGSVTNVTGAYWAEPNQNLTSNNFQSLSSSVSFNTATYPTTGISSSWTVITYIKPDPNNLAVGLGSNRDAPMTLWNINNTGDADPRVVMGAAFETPLGGRTFSGSIILTTGIPDGQSTTRIKSGSYDIPTSINMFDGNYHMIATKFTQIGTGSYASASVWIDGTHVTGSWLNPSFNPNEFQWSGGAAAEYRFGNSVSISRGFANQNYRAYLGRIKAWMTYGEALSNDDIQTIYSVLQRNTLSPATNVTQESITGSLNFAIAEGIKSKAFPGEIKGMAIWNRAFDQNDINNISNVFYIDDLAASENIVLP
jgi:hypothetical protein